MILCCKRRFYLITPCKRGADHFFAGTGKTAHDWFFKDASLAGLAIACPGLQRSTSATHLRSN
jgi:hypothetical protein